jgi:hypothetical protein
VADIEAQANQLSRYHLIKDLAVKGPDQISCFLQRVDQIYEYSERVQLSLISVLFDDCMHRDTAESFPLFDFIGIRTASCEEYGVMFSTYLHDLARDAISQQKLPENGSTLLAFSRVLMDSLYLPTCLNSNCPPFSGHKPVFVFPNRSRMMHSHKTSSTDQYMALLGYKANSLALHNDQCFMRCYYHESEDSLSDSGSIHPSIIAVGQACVEMAVSHADTARGCLKPFDRFGFSTVVQARQAWLAKRWINTLMKNIGMDQE